MIYQIIITKNYKQNTVSKCIRRQNDTVFLPLLIIIVRARIKWSKNLLPVKLMLPAYITA